MNKIELPDSREHIAPTNHRLGNRPWYEKVKPAFLLASRTRRTPRAANNPVDARRRRSATTQRGQICGSQPRPTDCRRGVPRAVEKRKLKCRTRNSLRDCGILGQWTQPGGTSSFWGQPAHKKRPPNAVVRQPWDCPVMKSIDHKMNGWKITSQS